METRKTRVKLKKQHMVHVNQTIKQVLFPICKRYGI